LSELPYERGEILRDTADDFTKLRRAWALIAEREGAVFNFTGLERSLGEHDDDLAPALVGERLTELALEHLGGDPERDDVFVANRMTAATVAAMQVLVRPGATVVGVAPGHSHASVIRAVNLAGGTFVEGGEIARADVLVLTRLAVTYEALPLAAIEAAVAEAKRAGIPIYVDDAGGARVGPAILGQPRTLELGADVGATGLDKYGTIGPRLGLLAGRAELVAQIRARAIELGMEARPLLWPAVVASLEQYEERRVRELVVATTELADALEQRFPWVDRTPVAVKLQGEDVAAEAARRAGLAVAPLAPIEATAALAMLLLRDHAILTVHFAALPPGTSALLLKFVPPETLARFGGPVAFADAVDESLDALADLLVAGGVAELLGAQSPRTKNSQRPSGAIPSR
jgi:L-seryl-tRNA(Ser) seleniumtransferase